MSNIASATMWSDITREDYKTCLQKAFVYAMKDDGAAEGENNDAVFYRTDPLFYHKFENMVIFRSGNLYSLCIIHF